MSSSPKEQYKKLKIDMHTHTMHVGSRTISEQYTTAQGDKCEHDHHPRSPDVCMRCTKRKKPMCQNWEESNKNFDSVSMKSLIFHIVKSVKFPKLESSASQGRAKIAYKIDTGSDGNLIPLWDFKILFTRSAMVELNATINRSTVHKCIIKDRATW